MVRAQLRDFETAHAHLAAAEALEPGSAWLWAVRARVLAVEDRREEGLEAARASLSERPYYRAGVQTAADLLVQLGRDDEARALLTEAAARLESAGVVAQLGVLARHQGDVATARRAFLRVLELSPELSRYSFEWLAGELEYVEYLSGNLDRARELAEFPRGRFYARIRERLSGATSVDRRLLDVPWVRQHHVTCAPATLTSIARLWKLPADHLEVAEAICYDGTPAASERRWAEEHGFHTREFTVDWATTIALIDRGVAFTLTTSAPGMGHLQAVAGYDRTRGTLLVRDPSSQGLSEYEHAALFEQQAPFGPRGMAMVPDAERHRLDGLALPDADAYDALYAVNRALDRHDRAAAAREVEALEARAPGHRLANDARAILAGYDQNTGAQLACAEAALARHPTDPRLLLWKLSCLRRLGGSHDRAALLDALAHHPRREPLGWLAVVDEHARDARFRPEVEAQLRRILRARPETARAYQVLGELAWRDEARPRALELYRLASCVAERDEELAQVYFSSARFAGVPEAGLAHLRARVDRLGGRAAGPALSLAWALEQLDRAGDAAEVLREAISARPDDGELLLGAAESALDRGEDEAAAALLARAEGRVSRAASLRLSARLASRRLDRAAAIAAHRELLEIDPLAIDSHRTLALASSSPTPATARRSSTSGPRSPASRSASRSGSCSSTTSASTTSPAPSPRRSSSARSTPATAGPSASGRSSSRGSGGTRRRSRRSRRPGRSSRARSISARRSASSTSRRRAGRRRARRTARAPAATSTPSPPGRSCSGSPRPARRSAPSSTSSSASSRGSGSPPARR